MDVEAGGADRTWSWAESSADVAARRRMAEQSVGKRIGAVTTSTLDYRRHELHPDPMDHGPRAIHTEGEWIEPTWRHSGVACDADAAIGSLGDQAISLAPMIGARVSAVELHYVAWSQSGEGQWCPHITFQGERSRVDLIVGDSHNGQLAPAADNVAGAPPRHFAARLDHYVGVASGPEAPRRGRHAAT